MATNSKPEAPVVAIASQLPHHSGDGYSYGGGSVVVVGAYTVVVGEGQDSWRIAKHIEQAVNQMNAPLWKYDDEQPF